MHELTPLRASLEDVFMELTDASVEYRSHRPPTPLPRCRCAGKSPMRGTRAMTIAAPAPTPDTGGRASATACRAEWTKLASLRSTKWTVLVTVVGTLLVTFLADPR